MRARALAVVSATLVAAAASTGCGVECRTSEDCGGRDRCNTIVGVCEDPFAAEDENGPLECTSDAAFDISGGEGEIVVDGAQLELDPGRADCGDREPWALAFLMRGEYALDFSGDEVLLAVNNRPAIACGAPLAGGATCAAPDSCAVVCPICFANAPQDAAMRVVDDAGGFSSPACVEIL